MYYRNLSRDLANSNQSETEKHSRHFDNANAPRRKASINELSEDEIVLAYNKLKAEKNASEMKAKNEDISSEMKEEFLRWMESKRRSEKSNPTMTSHTKQTEKVITNDETENLSDVINVVKSEHESEAAMDVTEQNALDFEEFQDVIEEDDAEYLKVPLVIHEDNDEGKEKQVDEENSQDKSMIPTVIGSDKQSETELSEAGDSEENNTIDVKITLSNSPLEIVTSLSSSNLSIASSNKSLDDTNTKKPSAKKRRAPAPPIDVIPGHYYDHVTKKHFKETEL